jgi:hypothetical protein
VAWAVLCVCILCQAEVCFCVLRFYGFYVGFPPVFRGPSGLSPTVAPEHLWVYLSGSRRCWSLLIGHSSLLVANAFRGAASADPRV